jgi:tetratricopeptide (TPR) repeat protein
MPYSPEHDETLHPMLRSLYEFRKKEGLNLSDIREAEQIISRFKDDYGRIGNELEQLYIELDEFDPRQVKIANVYVDLLRIIRDQSATSQTEPVRWLLSMPLQPGTEAREPDSPIAPEARERMIGLLNDIRGEASELLKDTSSFHDRFSQIEELIQKQADWNTLLNALKTAIEQAKGIVGYLQRFDEAAESQYRLEIALRSSIETLRTQLKAALEEDQDEGLRLWYQAYAFCLSEWAIERCSLLADSMIGLPDYISRMYSAASQRLVEGRYDATEIGEMLIHLVDKLKHEQAPDKLSITRLYVLQGRINLYHLQRPDVAKTLFEKAESLCPAQELPAAALGEYYLSQSEDDLAEAEFKRGLLLPPDLIDSYLGMGRLNENRERWTEADEWYDRAVDVVHENDHAVEMLGRLLAPVSGRAYLRLAVKLSPGRPEPALQAINCALNLGVNGDGNYTQAPALLVKAEILKRMGRLEEAVEALSEAGKYFNWRNGQEDLDQARQCLEDVIQLDGGKVANFWMLADTYLGLSYGDVGDETKREYIERGIEVWNLAAKRELPDESSYWAYATRSGLALREVEFLRGEDWPRRIDRWWQAVTMMERLMLVWEPRASDWTSLAIPFDKLRLYRNALTLSEKAFDLASDDIFVAEWRMIVLCNSSRYEDAIGQIEHRLKLRDDRSIYSILAWVKLHQGRYSDAVEIIERAPAGAGQEKLSIWDLDLRAAVYKRANDLERAKEAWEAIYQQIDEKNIDNLGVYANAAAGLGRLEEAIRLLRTPILLNDPIEGYDTLRDLGLFELRSGRGAEGWPKIDEGISLGRDVRTLKYFLVDCRGDLPLEEGDRVATLAQARIEELEQEQPPTCEEELIAAGGDFGAGESGRSWVRAGIKASLAHICREEGRWIEAANLYRQLFALEVMPDDGMPPFPEARQGLELCGPNLERLGDEAFRENKTGEAIPNYEEALHLSEDSRIEPSSTDDRTRAARLQAKLALALLDTDDIQGASSRMVAALNLYRQIEDADPVGKLADDLKRILRDAAHYWQVRDFFNRLMAEPNQAALFRQDLVTLNQAIFGYLEDFYQLEVEQSNFPTVLPVILEIGQSLIPEDTSVERWFLFTELIPNMRARIKEEMGVSTTGIRVRGLNTPSSPSPSYEYYRILLDEVLITEGRVYLDRKFCPNSMEEIKSAGIAIEELSPEENTRAGLKGNWIPVGSSGQAVEHGLELWDEPLTYVIQHLQSVLRRNLADFLGVEEVEALIKAWGEEEGGASLIEAALHDQASRLRLVAVLRALVKEDVPITRWQEILEAFQSAELKGNDLSEIVRAVRLRLKDSLPGNKPDVRRCELPLKWEEEIPAKWLRRENGQAFFTAPPAETHALLMDIRSLVDTYNGRFALVTRSSELRPFIRRLIEFEFPDLMALSREELLMEDDMEGTNHDDR